MSSIAYCQKPILPYSSWGGHIENGEVCGESLPECQSEDSSSSQNEESSSSEKLSSSSEESSSSVTESSSSKEGEGESSSSEDDCDDPDGCDIDRTGLECFNKYVIA